MFDVTENQECPCVNVLVYCIERYRSEPSWSGACCLVVAYSQTQRGQETWIVILELARSRIGRCVRTKPVYDAIGQMPILGAKQAENFQRDAKSSNKVLLLNESPVLLSWLWVLTIREIVHQLYIFSGIVFPYNDSTHEHSLALQIFKAPNLFRTELSRTEYIKPVRHT